MNIWNYLMSLKKITGTQTLTMKLKKVTVMMASCNR